MALKIEKCLWYFAYGSNMDSDKFTGSRGVIPLDRALVHIPDWVLVMEIPGLPYSEPAFASLRPRKTSGEECNRLPDAIGVAYLITEDQYRGVIASEGGGTAYVNIEVRGIGLTEVDREKLGNRKVRTLGSSEMTRDPFPAPSVRYMGLICNGAAESQLPITYQEYLAQIKTYHPSKSWWARLGAFIFLTLFGPVMSSLERITKTSIRSDGSAPPYVVRLVRMVILFIWAVHDWVFAPIFGPGDGRSNGGEESEFMRRSSSSTNLLEEAGKDLV